MGTWIVMSATDHTSRGPKGRSFDSNATGLTEAEANKEADRRNAVEAREGNINTQWFACEDPMAMLARMGLGAGFR